MIEQVTMKLATFSLTNEELQSQINQKQFKPKCEWLYHKIHMWSYTYGFHDWWCGSRIPKLWMKYWSVEYDPYAPIVKELLTQIDKDIVDYVIHGRIK